MSTRASTLNFFYSNGLEEQEIKKRKKKEKEERERRKNKEEEKEPVSKQKKPGREEGVDSKEIKKVIHWMMKPCEQQALEHNIT